MSQNRYSDDDLFALFSAKPGHPICGSCLVRDAVCIHEIEPKSKRPNTWHFPENRIPLCQACHDWAHNVASPGQSAKVFRLNRVKALRACGHSMRDVKRLGYSLRPEEEAPASPA